MIMARPGRRPTGETRRSVALLLRDTPATLPLLAEALSQTQGGLRTTMNALEADGLVERSAARPAVYALTAAGRKELTAEDASPAGMLGGVRLLSIFDEGRGAIHDALRLVSREHAVRWVARADGAPEVLVALDADDLAAADRLRAELGRLDIRCLATRVSAILTPRELQRQVAAVQAGRSLFELEGG